MVALVRVIRRAAETGRDVVVWHDMRIASAAIMRITGVINPAGVVTLRALHRPVTSRPAQRAPEILLLQRESDFAPLASRRKKLSAGLVRDLRGAAMKNFNRHITERRMVTLNRRDVRIEPAELHCQPREDDTKFFFARGFQECFSHSVSFNCERAARRRCVCLPRRGV